MSDEFVKEYDDSYNVRFLGIIRYALAYTSEQYMASRGHRVIACAQALLPGDKYPADYTFSKNDGNYPSEDYTFVGLVSLEDPPKHGVREAIGKLCVAANHWRLLLADHILGVWLASKS